MQKILSLYKLLLSPYFGNCCRFYPSCSSYWKLALHEYGLVKGCWLGTKRILRCNPLFQGGFDPVKLKCSK